MTAAAAFLDKDGTLVENLPYNADPGRMVLCRGVRVGVALLAARGYRIFVVTNQPGVALGLFDELALGAVERRLRELLADAGATLQGFYYCPHHPQASRPQYARNCECRKPRCGLLLRAAREHGIDLARSWMVGDILDDVETGRRAGCRTVLVDNGNETVWDLRGRRMPHYVACDFLSAARTVVGMTPSAARPAPMVRT